MLSCAHTKAYHTCHHSLHGRCMYFRMRDIYAHLRKKNHLLILKKLYITKVAENLFSSIA